MIKTLRGCQGWPGHYIYCSYYAGGVRSLRPHDDLEASMGKGRASAYFRMDSRRIHTEVKCSYFASFRRYSRAFYIRDASTR
eukprot:670086-Hanusia_phi.AAC.2